MTINLHLMLGLSMWRFFLILQLYSDAYVGFSALNVLTEWTDEELEADNNNLLDSPSKRNNIQSALFTERYGTQWRMFRKQAVTNIALQYICFCRW